MNATKRSVARAGLAVCSALAVALTGCRTQVVHEHTRTVYVPATPVVYVPPTPAPQPAPTVVVVPPPEQPPVVDIQSENDFYEPLASHGRWVVVGSYGRCWIPARVEAGWRPYSNGYWQRTDAGWYWASDEPWGWATYHYGRWDFHAQYGWVWVPQTQWAPAWVSWREGGGYVGWAPLRPSARIGVSVGVEVYEPAFASRAFVFVEHRRMLEPIRPKTVIVNNTTIINKTVNITNVKVVNKTVINEGPRIEVIERESGRKVQAVPVHEFRRREEATVAARQRNIPTAPERKVERAARTEPQRAEKKIVLPPVALQAAKPAEAVTQPRQLLATPARPTPPRPEMGGPARDEKKYQAEIARKVATAPPTVEPGAKPEAKPTVLPRREVRPVEKPAVAARPTPQPATTFPVRDEKNRETAIEKKKTATPPTIEPAAKPEVKSEQTVAPRREARSVEKPVVAAKPTPQPVTTFLVRDDKKRETSIERKNTATPLPVEPRPRQEVRPETRRETNLPAKVDAVPPSAVRRQAAPPSENPADKRQMSPREKSRTAEQTAANKKKKSEDQDAPLPVGPTRPPR